MQRSIYGSLLAKVGVHPIILGLQELMGIQALADNLVEVSDKALARKSINPQVIIAVCTDSPTTMQAFHHE